MEKNGYIIHVGTENTPPVIIAHPDKETGRPKEEGEVAEQIVRVGTHQLMNRARVWGRRIIRNGSTLKTQAEDGSEIQFSSKDYKGEVEFLTWQADGGFAIEIRYLPTSNSLDFEYQDQVQKIKVDPNKGFTHIDLKTGQNQFDYKKQALLIQFWKVHPQNRDSVSKNPDPEIKGYKFFEVTDKHVDQTIIRRIESGAEAVTLLKEISNKPGTMKTLFKVLGKKIGGVSELSLDLEIYKGLMEYVSANAEEFFQLVNSYKMGVQDAFERAKSEKALDLTKHGHIAFLQDGKPQIITSAAEGKGNEMVSWMVDNYYDEEVYKATQILKELVSKLK